MKVFKGKVISTKMKDTVVVEVTRRTPHPLYKKLLKRSSKFKVSAVANTLSVGESITIVETRPISRHVHFKVMEAKTKSADVKPVSKAKTVVVETETSQGSTSPKATSNRRRAKK
jgi:small subunit ribosomal protein S17